MYFIHRLRFSNTLSFAKEPVLHTENIFISFKSFLPKSKIKEVDKKGWIEQELSETSIQIIDILGKGLGNWSKKDKTLEIAIIGVAKTWSKDRDNSLEVKIKWADKQSDGKLNFVLTFIYFNKKINKENIITLPLEIEILGKKSGKAVKYITKVTGEVRIPH